MLRVRRYLEMHLDEAIDCTALSRLAGLSPRQLERVFARTMGETPRACLRRLRLERAAAKLRRSRSSILEIAMHAGFGSHEAFTRVFRQRFGHSPAAFRKLDHAALQPRARVELWRLIGATGLRPYVEQRSAG